MTGEPQVSVNDQERMWDEANPQFSGLRVEDFFWWGARPVAPKWWGQRLWWSLRSRWWDILGR